MVNFTTVPKSAHVSIFECASTALVVYVKSSMESLFKAHLLAADPWRDVRGCGVCTRWISPHVDHQDLAGSYIKY